MRGPSVTAFEQKPCPSEGAGSSPAVDQPRDVDGFPASPLFSILFCKERHQSHHLSPPSLLRARQVLRGLLGAIVSLCM